MRISKVGGAGETGSTRKKDNAAGKGGSFADSLKGVQGGAEQTPAMEGASVGNIDAVFAVQEVPDALDQRSRKMLVSFGEDVLDRLDDIKIGILNGSFSKEKLANLAQLLRQKKQSSDDETLNELISEIELRAEVEIAKLSRRSAS